MLETKRRVPKYADAAHELLTMDEVDDRYYGEWVLLLVERTDDRDQITHGYVLAHAKSPSTITKSLAKLYAVTPHVRVATFLAGRCDLTGEAWARHLEQVTADTYVNAHW